MREQIIEICNHKITQINTRTKLGEDLVQSRGSGTGFGHCRSKVRNMNPYNVER